MILSREMISMKYKRFYPPKSKNKFVWSDEQFKEMVAIYGMDTAVEMDTAYIQLVPETVEEHKQLFNDSCERVLLNTRFYLDNLDKIPTFNVSITKVFPEMIK